MNLTLCGPSAFRFHRIPPQFIGLFPPLPYLARAAQWRLLRKHPLFEGTLGFPVHRLVDDSAPRGSHSLIKDHLFSGELSFGSIQETPFGFDVTSPLMTLFSLSSSLCEEHLIMAMYELCGNFAVFTPSRELQTAYNEAVAAHQIDSAYGWKRTHHADGSPSSLWQRDPLIEVSELLRFAHATAGLRGHKKFLKCAKSVTGVAASPFEVETSILLSLPARRGGYGFKSLQNNAEIKLLKNARTIAGGYRRYADIYFEGDIERPPLDIECQGSMIHDSSASAMSDADRATALQSMGVDVILLTHDQIYYAKNFEAVCELLAHKLQVKPRKKSPDEQMAEAQLRNKLFIDWNDLGK